MVNHGKIKKVRFGLEGPKPNWKKAIVTLKEGDAIDFFSDAAADATAKK